MNKEMQIFKNDEFGQVRTLVIDNEPYFVGKDVAEVLGYAKTQNAIATHVDEDDTLKQGIIDNLGRMQQTTVINESGLYSLILSSKLPNAKKFKRWVTSEVLPQIRKNGSYQIPKISKELQAIFMIDGKTEELKNELNGVKNEVTELKNNMPLLGVDCDEIVKVVKSVATKALGGYQETPAYKDKSLNHKVYSDIYGQLKREFQVNSYKAIKRCHIDKAKEIIKNYKLPTVLADEITRANNQVSFEEAM